jgi:hypothetical protein
VTSPSLPLWTPADLRRLLSPGRFDRYAAAAGGPAQAVDLYVWNSRIGGALHESIGQFEVILRNALDLQLVGYHQIKLKGSGDWYSDSAMPWRTNRKTLATIAGARDKATVRQTVPEVHGKVVAELGLGFWRFLLAAQYETTLWAPALRRAFPHLPSGRRNAVYAPVERLHALRNRVAHHEPIHAKNLAARYAELLAVAGWIDPAAAEWIAETSRVPAIIAVRP